VIKAMLNSVRARLTLWYTVVLALVLVAFSLAAYFFLARAIKQQTDNSLAEVARAFTATVSAEQRDEPEEAPKDAAINEAVREFRFKDYYFAVYDEAARVVATSELPVIASSREIPDLQTLDSYQIKNLIEAANPSKSRSTNLLYETLARGETQFRVAANAMLSGKGTYRIIILRSLQDQEELLEQLGRALSIAVPLALLIASLGGYFLARKSLAPVLAMSNQAAHISAANLHERLDVANKSDELGRLASVFNDLLARLNQSFEQQRRFMADASHELRTPVSILRGEAEVALLKTTRTPEEYRESLAIVHDEGRRLARIVEDLFTLARSDAGQHPLTTTDFYLDELVEECARAVRTLATQNGLVLECVAPAESLMRGDESLLRRLILNLLDNAIKHTPAGGFVRIALERREDNYEISVSDTGGGIPFDAQPYIFERFYRADSARARPGNDGAGLGLSIARLSAQAHGGKLFLACSNETGSTFIATIPAPHFANQ
jgi:heavy metal sensor kinase